MSADARPPGGAPPPRSPGLRATQRIRGIDVARAFAILGMATVHFTLTGVEGAGGGAAGLPDGPRGRAAILFVLLAGVGVTLLDRSRSASRERTRRRLLWRSAVLFPVGLALQALDHGIAVILQDYALLFLVAIVALALSDRALTTAVGLAFVLGPAVHVAAEAALTGVVFGAPVAPTDPPLAMVRGLLLSGTYPLVTHVAPLLLGMRIARLDLVDPRVQARLLSAGAILALALLWGGVVLAGVTPAEAPVWWQLAVTDEPHSQSFVWLWQASAAAVAALAACLVATEALPRLLTPFVAMGQLALTVYVGHLLVIAIDQDTVRTADVTGAGLRVLVFTVLAALLATAWRTRFRRGPLESLLDVPFSAHERRRAGGPRAGRADDRRAGG